MTMATEHQQEQACKTRACADHDHDLIHELSRRLDSLWRYDQYIANAEWREKPRQFWEDLKRQEQENIHHLKELLAEEVHNDCF